MKVKYAFILAALVFSVNVYSKPFKTLVSVEGIQSKTDDFFVDGTIKFPIKENSKEFCDINYSYSRVGPTPACGSQKDCMPTSESVITFYIDGGGLVNPVNINYMCTSIGSYNSYHNGMRDLHCGP